MYRSKETKDLLREKLDADGLWDDRNKGIQAVLDELVEKGGLKSAFTEAYLFGYQHALGIRMEDQPEGDIASALLKFLEGFGAGDLDGLVVDGDDQPPIIPA